jgi:RNA polymerase sigma-70 factor, ECF subfamily
MTDKKKEDEIKRALIADAANPKAWDRVATVPPSRSPRPVWYGKSRGLATRHAIADSKDVRFTAAYSRYYTRVVRYYTRAFGLAEDDAIDLAQQAFLRFDEALDHYRGEAEWAFLETVVRNVAYNRVRALKSASRSAQVVSIEDARAKRQAPTQPPVDHASREAEALRRKQLHDAIANLSEGQRHAIQLWLDGFHYTEIAQVLGVSVDAVKSRLRDAKRHLRPTLEGGDSRNGHRSGGVKSR